MPFDSNYNSLQNTHYGNIARTNIAPEHYTKLMYPALKAHENKSDDMETTVMQGDGIGKLFRDAKKAVQKVEKQTRPAKRAIKTAANKAATEVAKKVNKKATKAVLNKVLNELNEEQLNNAIVDEVLEGEGIGKAFKRAGKKIAQSAKRTGRVIKQTAIKSGDAIKKSAVNKNGLIHNLIESTADVVIPELATAVGAAISTATTGDPTSGAYAGKMVGQVARKTLKKQTGYGVGTYEGGAHVLDQRLSKYATPTGKEIDRQMNRYAGISAQAAAGKSRNAVVKQVMQEQGLSLPAASKYVKDHGLY